MSTTPCQTPKATKSRTAAQIAGTFGTPMFIPPTPMLQNLGYGTGVEVYRIERSPLATGHSRSPWAVKRITRHGQRDAKAAAAYRQRLTAEADILRQLDHPNIVGFRGHRATHDGRAALIMEMCDTSLGDLLEARHEDEAGPLSAVHIRRVAGDIFGALDYLHTKVRLLHADIKSHNILVKAQFAVCKLCDFGVSLPLTADGYVDVVAKPGARYVGTNLWSAPEALSVGNEVNIGCKADVFSMGLVIYECVALIPPHTWVIGDGEEEEEDEVDENDKDDEDGDDSMEPEDEMEMLCGTRPPMPESAELGDEYNVVVELFYVCTNQEPEDRPTAGALVQLLNEQQPAEEVEEEE